MVRSAAPLCVICVIPMLYHAGRWRRLACPSVSVILIYGRKEKFEVFEKSDAFKYIEEKKSVFTSASDYLWEQAELAFKEYKSAARLEEVLQEEGFAVETGLADIPTAFRAVYGSGHPVIGILGEFDALAGLSQEGGVAVRQPRITGNKGAEKCGDASDGSQSEDNDAGHGCGHNCLGSGALAGAVGAKKFLENHPEMSGTIIYFGCPGEEGKSGKAFMARAGVFDGVDCALTWHSYGTNNVFSGSTLAVINMIFKFKGVAAHAAVVPHLGRSALDAAELMNVGVQFLREHMPDDARVHYAFLDAGGKAPNVVQERAELIYKVRSPRLSDVIELAARVRRIAEGAAMMTDTELSVAYHGATSNTIPNEVLERVLWENMDAIGAPEYTAQEEDFAKAIVASYEMPEKAVDLAATLSPKWKKLLEAHYEAYGVGINNFVLPYEHWEHPIPASTDVGDVSWLCPTAMFFAQCAAAKIPEHSWQYVACNNTSIAHKGLIYAGKILAGAAIDLLMSPELVDKAKTEFEGRLDGEKYQCPLHPDEKPRL